jgi:DMSO/TMAO reductase YedYZ molybdopterin-dependent catalytic subunit
MQSNDDEADARLRTAGRRRFFARLAGGLSVAFLAGCDSLSRSEWFPRLLGNTEKLTRKAQKAVTSRTSMAQEFTEADLSPTFRSNGTASPDDEEYKRHVASGFADWRLRIDGEVAQPREFSLAELRAMPARTQITRHDCVEGWSAIGKWTGVPLAVVLANVQITPRARFVVFHCADPMDNEGSRYYESIDLEDAHHPQTILAYELNGKVLPVPNGAPIRLRVERQLGYKQAKYIMRIELVQGFEDIGEGNGGYWEDQGYEWHAGI